MDSSPSQVSSINTEKSLKEMNLSNIRQHKSDINEIKSRIFYILTYIWQKKAPHWTETLLTSSHKKGTVSWSNCFVCETQKNPYSIWM